MTESMTGFASVQGSHEGASWNWELRSVNAKGLDVRLRLPEGLGALEAPLKARAGAALTRGNLSATLRVQRASGTGAAALDAQALEAVLVAMAEVEAQAMERGLSLAPATPADILALRGVLEARSPEAGEDEALMAAISRDFDAALAGLVEMRRDEGRALGGVLHAQVDRVETLTRAAADLAEARAAQMADSFRAALARVMENAEAADPQRLAQELAMLAVKADVTEEIDRLRAHVEAARALLGAEGPVGRKLDFLTQEFNREANTLCSKSQHPELTRIGLDLKAVIDQMREQVQNVE